MITDAERDRAFKYGVGTASNTGLARSLLEMADKHLLHYDHVAMVVEAAARLNSDTYTEYMGERRQ